MSQPYIIGETAFHHEGDKAFLKRMIEDIGALKLSAVKFHLLLNPNQYFQKKHPLKTELEKFIFKPNEWSELFDFAESKRLDIIALCNDVDSLLFILENHTDISGIEIHATGINDFHLLEHASKFKQTIYLGIGGCTLDEIQTAILFLRKNTNTRIVLMYGFQAYPTNISEINLARIEKLRLLFDVEIGYTDHTIYNDPLNEFNSVLGCCQGIQIIEKHYSPTPGKERIDYHSAIGFDQMKKIKKLAEHALLAYGNSDFKFSAAEKNYGNVGPVKKAIVASVDIKKGETLTMDKLAFKRTELESLIHQRDIVNLIGLVTAQDIQEDELITLDMINFKFQKLDESNFTNLKK